jgi:hypothetical protein
MGKAVVAGKRKRKRSGGFDNGFNERIITFPAMSHIILDDPVFVSSLNFMGKLKKNNL